jgi:SNF2 family DNA or RNA helicase
VADNYSFKLKTEPRLTAKHRAFAYQQEATDFVVGRDYSAIFHEQGLGKTKIAIDAGLSWLQRQIVDTVLIFAKKALVENWRNEFAEHTFLRPSVLSENSAANYYVFTTPVRVVLAHYEVAKKEEQRLAKWLRTRKVAVVLDEAVKIKNPDSDLARAFFRLSPLFAKRVIMTGTPAANRPYDVWAPIFFLDQGDALGTDFIAFKRATDLPKDIRPSALNIYKDRLDDVQRRLSSISVRETKGGGCIVLPDKEFVRVECRWESTQFELYRQVREQLRAVVIRDGRLIDEDQESILKRLLRLVQITSNPALVDESYTAQPGKFPALYDLVSDIMAKQEKVIIFTQFNETSRWLARELKPFGALLLNGQMPMGQRNDAVKWFKENQENRVLVATTGAAKEGLTLTVANHVIFFDRGYSLDDYLQSQDRIHRVSQVRKCFVYNLIIPDSVEEWIDTLLDQKRLAAQLTQGDINKEEYANRADYSFIEILQEILDK